MQATNPWVTPQCHRAKEALARIGDKWSILILMQLADGPKRYGALRRDIGEISPKMLAATLRALEREGHLSRTVLPTRPPNVEYALTDLGAALVGPVSTLGTWVLEHINHIEAARARFDADA